MQQQLDLCHHTVITQTRLLTWLQSYYCAQDVMARVKAERSNNQITTEPCKSPEETNKSSPRCLSERVSASKRLFCQGITDWNQRYSDIQSTKSSGDVFASGSVVSGLLAEFRQAAELLVSEIVTEMALEDTEKTLLPQSLEDDEFFATDGVQVCNALQHVVLKYQRDGLLVYLCSINSTRGISLEKRQSAASMATFHTMVGHQIRAARAIHEAIGDSNNGTQSTLQDILLQVPLQCTVDHLGFRAFVIASPHQALKSIRRNLMNEAKKNHVKQLWDQLKVVFDNLGLLTDSLHTHSDEQKASFPDGSTTVPAFFPVSAGFTVETKDGATAFKLQNLVDLIPADVSSDEPDAIAHEILVYKMRPEFVRMHGNNLLLHSNTHVPMEEKPCVDQNTSKESFLEIQLLQQSAISARECLHTIVIPEFVADLENATVQVIDSRSLTRALHGEGI
ncbi:hypothetical protein PHPALM_27453, partial [Phytophthora palmivora]